MNILLVNNDAAVEKLVRLSTQKTGDRLDVARKIEDVRDENYDLLIMDKGRFSTDALEALNDKAIYAHSVYITTREEGGSSLFEKTLYKPFLPTELLVLLHQFSTVVKEEQELLAKEIDFDALEDDFFTEQEAIGASETEKESVVPSDEDMMKVVSPSEHDDEEVLENIFSEEEVMEVKSILDALHEDETDDEIADEVIEEEAILDDVDLELEMALQNMRKGLSEHSDTGASPRSTSETMQWENTRPSQQNQESIETLRTLLKALENPQIARSLRGTITINLTFGED